LTTLVFQTHSPRETFRLGKRIGSRLEPGDVIALVGELGTGKTHLIQGLAAGAGIGRSSYVSSPSFTLIHEYAGKVPFYHIDLYRLAAEKEAEALGLEDYVGGKGITAIEWADKIPSLLPREILMIRLSYLGEHSRSVEIAAVGTHYEAILGPLSGGHGWGEEHEKDPEAPEFRGSDSRP
jgi:tRNA threonylcarbamoyladenosine biosynthesis protein TsaE